MSKLKKKLRVEVLQPPAPKLVLAVGTGTPFGLSHWSSWLNCGRRAHLNREHPYANASEPEYLIIGSVFHALAAQHYKGGLFNLDHVVYEPTPPIRARQKAEELYRAYRLHFQSNDCLGTVTAVEQLYGAGVGAKKRVAQSISNAVGAYPLPYTFQPDMEIEVSAEDQERIKAARGVKLRTGAWLVDHKTSSGWGEVSRHTWSLQATAYMLGWEAAHRRKPRGMLFNVIFKSPITFASIVHPYPNAAEVTRLRTFFALVKRTREALGDQWLNPSACHGFQTCPHWTSGLCLGGA